MTGATDRAADLVGRVGAGDARAVARLISLVEEGAPGLPGLLAALERPARPAHVVGLTGPPGVGKSTMVNALVREYRARGARVGVLAVDPSSTRTGGALLGDRVRMQEHALDPEVYLRSMASRGRLGGLSWTTSQAVRVLEAAGCDPVLVETVGVGQNEIDIAGLAHSTVVVLAPGTGDAVQAAKAGLLEVGEVYVVNKAESPEADRLRRELTSMLRMSSARWRAPVCLARARDGEGVAEVVTELLRHRDRVLAEEPRPEEARRRAREELASMVEARVAEAWCSPAMASLLEEIEEDLVRGRTEGSAAASRLLAAIAGQTS